MMVGNVLFGGVIGAGIDTADSSGFSSPKVINDPLQPKYVEASKKVSAIEKNKKNK